MRAAVACGLRGRGSLRGPGQAGVVWCGVLDGCAALAAVAAVVAGCAVDQWIETLLRLPRYGPPGVVRGLLERAANVSALDGYDDTVGGSLRSKCEIFVVVGPHAASLLHAKLSITTAVLCFSGTWNLSDLKAHPQNRSMHTHPQTLPKPV